MAGAVSLLLLRATVAVPAEPELVPVEVGCLEGVPHVEVDVVDSLYHVRDEMGWDEVCVLFCKVHFPHFFRMQNKNTQSHSNTSIYIYICVFQNTIPVIGTHDLLEQGHRM